MFTINPPFWTLAVDVQFYLLLPLIFLLVRRLRAGPAAAVLLMLGLAAYFAHYFILDAVAGSGAARPGFDPVTELSPVLTSSLLAYLPHFLMGMVTGWIFVAHRPRPAAPGKANVGLEVVFWIGVALLVLCVSPLIDGLPEIPYGRYHFPFVPAVLCLVILLTPMTASGRLLESRPFRWIGGISYGIYLCHYPILEGVSHAMRLLGANPRESWEIFGAVSLALTLAVAAASSWLLEKPLLAAARSRTQRRTAPDMAPAGARRAS